MNTFFDDPLMLEIEDVETTPKELEEIIEEVFYEHDYEEIAYRDAVEDMTEDEALIEDSLAMTNIYDIQEE